MTAAHTPTVTTAPITATAGRTRAGTTSVAAVIRAATAATVPEG